MVSALPPNPFRPAPQKPRTLERLTNLCVLFFIGVAIVWLASSMLGEAEEAALDRETRLPDDEDLALDEDLTRKKPALRTPELDQTLAKMAKPSSVKEVPKSLPQPGMPRDVEPEEDEHDVETTGEKHIADDEDSGDAEEEEEDDRPPAKPAARKHTSSPTRPRVSTKSPTASQVSRLQVADDDEDAEEEEEEDGGEGEEVAPRVVAKSATKPPTRRAVTSSPSKAKSAETSRDQARPLDEAREEGEEEGEQEGAESKPSADLKDDDTHQADDVEALAQPKPSAGIRLPPNRVTEEPEEEDDLLPPPVPPAAPKPVLPSAADAKLVIPDDVDDDVDDSADDTTEDGEVAKRPAAAVKAPPSDLSNKPPALSDQEDDSDFDVEAAPTRMGKSARPPPPVQPDSSPRKSRRPLDEDDDGAPVKPVAAGKPKVSVPDADEDVDVDLDDMPPPAPVQPAKPVAEPPPYEAEEEEALLASKPSTIRAPTKPPPRILPVKPVFKQDDADKDDDEEAAALPPPSKPISSTREKLPQAAAVPSDREEQEDEEPLQTGGPPLAANNIPCDSVRVLKECGARPECMWTDDDESRGFFCEERRRVNCPDLPRKSKCVARPDCDWVRVSTSKYGCRDVTAAAQAAAAAAEEEEEEQPQQQAEGELEPEHQGEEAPEAKAKPPPLSAVVAKTKSPAVAAKTKSPAVAAKTKSPAVAAKPKTAAPSAAATAEEEQQQDEDDEEGEEVSQAGEPYSESSESLDDGEEASSSPKPCSASHVKSSCSAKPHCAWGSSTKTRGKYCEDKVVRMAHPDAALFKAFVANDDEEESDGIGGDVAKPRSGPLDWLGEKRDMMCSRHAECAARDNLTVAAKWPPRLLQTYKPSQCCQTHPHLRLMLHAAADFFSRIGVQWWLGPEETAGARSGAAGAGGGALLPWQTTATVYVALYGGASLSDAAKGNSTVLKSTKYDFVSRLVKFNADQKYLPYTMRVCANKYVLPKALGKPATYSREWLNATRTSTSSTCYLVSRASSIPSSKTPAYFTIAHADMDPSPSIRIVPRLVRGSCVEPWRSGGGRDGDFLPTHWVLPTVPCGLYGRAMQCARAPRAMDWIHFTSPAGSSAWTPRAPLASELQPKLKDLQGWIENDFCTRGQVF